MASLANVLGNDGRTDGRCAGTDWVLTHLADSRAGFNSLKASAAMPGLATCQRLLCRCMIGQRIGRKRLEPARRSNGKPSLRLGSIRPPFQRVHYLRLNVIAWNDRSSAMRGQLQRDVHLQTLLRKKRVGLDGVKLQSCADTLPGFSAWIGLTVADGRPGNRAAALMGRVF